MKYFLPLFFGAFFLCALFPQVTHATVRINEVAWMGTAGSQYSEWIELYNDGDSDVSLAGWTLNKTADVLLFTLSKTISADGYLLVERTTASAPDAVPGVDDESGTFGGGGLKNTGEDLTLKDQDGNPIYILPYASAWPAGDAKTKDTMQWNGSSWITAPGTPDAINATKDAVVQPDNTDTNPTVTETPAVTATTIPTPITTPAVVVNQPPAAKTPVVTPQVQTPAATPTPVGATPVIISQTPAVVLPKPTPIVVPNNPAPAKVATKVSTKKSTTVSATTPATNTASNDVAADQLEANATAPKENNHTKIIIFIVVAFIGTALFLLLNRLKASQE